MAVGGKSRPVVDRGGSGRTDSIRQGASRVYAVVAHKSPEAKIRSIQLLIDAGRPNCVRDAH